MEPLPVSISRIKTVSLEMRRRVKEQLKKLGGMEFYAVNFYKKMGKIYIKEKEVSQ